DGRTARFSRSQLDPLLSPVLQSELPGLAITLDEDAMRPLLQATLFGDGARYQIDRCNPGRAIYLGGDFCGVRYELEVRDTAAGGAPSWRVVYGKVAADGSGERTLAVIAALRERLAQRGDRVSIPRVFGFWPDLQLLLLEAIPGRSFISRLLKEHLTGTETP